MERENEIIRKIRKTNLEIIITEVASGRVPNEVVKRIALKMGGTVHGMYTRIFSSSKPSIVSNPSLHVSSLVDNTFV